MTELQKQLFALINALGTQKAVAEALRARGVPVSTSTINRLRQGLTKNPSYDLGRGIEALFVDRVASPPKDRQRKQVA